MFSGKNIYNFAILENLRIFQNCLFTGGVITESGSCRAGFLRKHSRGGVNVLLVFSGLNPLRSWHAAGVIERVLPASTSLSSMTPAHENGVQKRPQAFLDPKIKNIISLAYAQSKCGAHSKSSHTAGVCGLFYPFIGTKPTRSFTTSPPMIRPATEGTKALEPGTERRWVHLRWVPGGQMQ